MTDERTERVARLIDQHGRMVFATAYRILGHPEDAQDVLQNVFLKVLARWNRRLKPHAIRDWGAYLRVAATRNAVDQLRRNRYRERNIGEDVETLQAPDRQNPRATAARREKARLLRQALRALPKREARVFALRHFEDLSYEQIAQHTGLSVNHVGVVLHRARERLRKTLEPLLRPTGTSHAAPQQENKHVTG